MHLFVPDAVHICFGRFPQVVLVGKNRLPIWDRGLIPRLGRSPGEGNGHPPQYSCLENPIDRGAWQATVNGVARVRQNLATTPPPPPPIFHCIYVPRLLYPLLISGHLDCFPERVYRTCHQHRIHQTVALNTFKILVNLTGARDCFFHLKSL